MGEGATLLALPPFFSKKKKTFFLQLFTIICSKK
jgi:hypothetical protein